MEASITGVARHVQGTFAMKTVSLAWTIWRLMVVASLWLGFKQHWPFSTWMQLGLVLLCPVAFGGLSFWWQARFARAIASLPAEERKRRLAAMPLKRREHVLQWIESHEFQTDPSFAKAYRDESTKGGAQ
jgi:hypothetical protein